MRTISMLAACLGPTLAFAGEREGARRIDAEPAGQPVFRWADHDGDGLVDALVLQPGRPARLLANRGAAGFVDVTDAVGLAGLEGASKAQWHDFDGDGRLDLLVIAPTGRSALFRGTSEGMFLRMGPESGLELDEGVLDGEWIDFDGDGLTDLRLTTPTSDLLYRNMGAAGFERTATELPPRAGDELDFILGQACPTTIRDAALPGTCIPASTIPTMGMLFPISTQWFVHAATGRVGIGNTNPATALDVAGVVRSRSGGIQYPDGSVQTTATLVGPPGEQGPQGEPGEDGAPGVPGAPGDSHWDLNGSSTYYNDGRVGIGTSTPGSRLYVTESASTSAIFGTNAGSGAGVWGHQTALTGIRDGVGGRSDSIAGRGVFGWATSSSGNAYGVQGQSDSQTGRGLYGRASSGSGITYGVFGETNSASGFGGYFIGPVGSQNYFQRSVGIGTTSPSSTLSVVGGADVTGAVSIGVTGADARLLVRGSLGEDAFRVRVETATKVVVKDNGGVGIGSNYSSVPANGMRVFGSVGIGNADPGATFDLAVNGDCAKPGGGLWSVYSDARLKHDIEPLEAGTLDRLLSLHGYTFEYDEEAIAKRVALPGRQTGLLAQEVEEAFPEWVDVDEEGYLYVTERGLTAIVVEALRELRTEKDEELADLRRENTLLAERLDRVEARLESAGE